MLEEGGRVQGEVHGLQTEGEAGQSADPETDAQGGEVRDAGVKNGMISD